MYLSSQGFSQIREWICIHTYICTYARGIHADGIISRAMYCLCYRAYTVIHVCSASERIYIHMKLQPSLTFQADASAYVRVWVKVHTLLTGGAGRLTLQDVHRENPDCPSVVL